MQPIEAPGEDLYPVVTRNLSNVPGTLVCPDMQSVQILFNIHNSAWESTSTSAGFCAAAYPVNMTGTNNKQPADALLKTEPYFFGTEIVMLRYWMTPW